MMAMLLSGRHQLRFKHGIKKNNARLDLVIIVQNNTRTRLLSVYLVTIIFLVEVKNLLLRFQMKN